MDDGQKKAAFKAAMVISINYSAVADHHPALV